MERLEYLLVEPACDVNEKGTREKNDGNEDVSLDDSEKIEAKRCGVLCGRRLERFRTERGAPVDGAGPADDSRDKEWQSQKDRHEVH